MATFALDHRQSSSRSRSTRRSSTSPGAVRRLGSPDRRSPAACATPSPTSRASPARWAWPRPSSSPSSPPASPSPTGMIVVPRDEVVAVPAPAAGRRALGRRRAHRGGPARASGLRTVADIAHTPLDDPRSGPSATPPAATCTTSPGAATPGRSCPSGARRASAPTRPSPTTSTTRPTSTASCCALSDRTAARVRAAGHDGPHRHRSRCGSPTSRRSPGPAPCATPPTSAATSTPRPASLFDALGLQRARIRLVGVRLEGLVDAGRRRPSRGPSTSPSTAGARPTGPSTGPAPGSVSGSVRPASLILNVTHRLPQRRPARPILRVRGQHRVAHRAARADHGRICAPLRARAEDARTDGAGSCCRGPQVRLADAGQSLATLQRRRWLVGAVGVIAGLALVLVGVNTTMWVGAGGFALMVASAVFAAHPAQTGPPRASCAATAPPTRAPRAASKKGKSSFMDRLDERWERRQNNW